MLRYERLTRLARGSLLLALQSWTQASAMFWPSGCDFACCGGLRPDVEMRDALEELIRVTPARAGRELRELVRVADTRIVGAADAFWWRDQRYWR
ncbi:hypothetical protein [Cellulosimicrobium protaetiae]|uniref:Uncharacterized protein n=1 Tax=Cellulosimicrobium protaetiae TaxID=2587808 RepID=A0A6M5UEG2_9MICO|nr:hypothetical protein [Cellulosimicrobium protaetiae]QJW35645.1 hypothetical protein FIC82_004935 [Cellulosimicrobium protaetiae]